MCDKEKWQQMRKNNATARTTGDQAGEGHCHTATDAKAGALQWLKEYRLTENDIESDKAKEAASEGRVADKGASNIQLRQCNARNTEQEQLQCGN